MGLSPLKMNCDTLSSHYSVETMACPMRGESECCRSRGDAGRSSDASYDEDHQGFSRRSQCHHEKFNLSPSSSSHSSSASSSSSSSSFYSHVHNVPRSQFAAVLFALLLVATTIGQNPVNGIGDPVYIRKSNGYLQLLSSDTLRWFKQGTAKEPLKLLRPNLDPAVICRVWHTSLRGVGLVSEDQSVCNISTQEGAQGSDKYQTLSTSASRLVWKLWQRPNPPPIGAVAISFKPAKFLATDLNSTVIGYLDPSKNLGSGVFPNEQEPAQSCLVLTEVEPERYELSDVQLKRNKGFIEEDIVLAYGRLKYELPTSSSSSSDSRSINSGGGEGGSQVDNGWSAEDDAAVELKPESNEVGDGLIVGDMEKKGKVESILSYETNTLDSWGQGYLMAKGLHTSIKLDDGSTKTIEWGIPSTQAGKTETMTAVAELAPGTGVNVTLRGTRIDGEMNYWSTLKTIFKDGTSSTRLLEGHRRIKDIQDIRLEHSRIYFLNNDSIVPDPTTTTTTTTTTTPLPIDISEELGDEEDEDGGPLRENALPSRNEFLADQGHSGVGMSVSAHDKSNSPAASVAHSGAPIALSSSLTGLSSAALAVSILLRTVTMIS